MDTVIIDAGTLEFSETDLTATGLLVPFGVMARSNLGEFTFAPGDITIPTDCTGMSLNTEHKRENVVGGFTRAWETDAGVMATFKYRDTAEGRAAFEDGKSGKRKCLSAEVAGVRIRDRKALPGAVLFAAAQVEKPAFEGATLLAAEDTPEPDDDRTVESRYVTEYTDAAGATWRRVEETSSTTTQTDQGTETTTTTTVTETTDAAETIDADEAEESTLTATAHTINVPATLLAAAPRGVETIQANAEDIDLGVVFASIAAVKNKDRFLKEDAATLLAALADIKYEAAGGLTTADSGVLQPAWVGKLWQGKRYNRKYIDLATHLYGGIQIGGRGGYTMSPNGELVGEWAGNKVELPTGTASTAKKNATLHRYGWAADIAREWFDLEGGAEFIEELLKLVVDSYARVTDRRALTDIVSAASTAAAANDRIITPGSLPANTPANSAYYPAVVQLIQAIEVITDADDDPGFAIVNPAAWAQLIYTPKDLLPEFVTLAVGPGTGEGNVDGKVTVKKAPQAFFPGTKSTDPQIVAGAKSAIEFRELGETPIQLDALDLARGGVDKAVLGYLETFVVRPESLALIGTKSA